MNLDLKDCGLLFVSLVDRGFQANEGPSDWTLGWLWFHHCTLFQLFRCFFILSACWCS